MNPETEKRISILRTIVSDASLLFITSVMILVVIVGITLSTWLALRLNADKPEPVYPCDQSTPSQQTEVYDAPRSTL